jgi:thiosulfate dehydrogenase
MGKQGSERSVKSLAIFVGAAILGLVAGYLLWGRAVDWYDVPDVAKLKDSPENDLIRYGHELIVDTAGQIGKNAKDADKRYAGNELACAECRASAFCRAFRLDLRHVSDDGGRSSHHAHRAHQWLHAAKHERSKSAGE